jgi:hypothetical protein
VQIQPQSLTALQFEITPQHIGELTINVQAVSSSFSDYVRQVLLVEPLVGFSVLKQIPQL